MATIIKEDPVAVKMKSTNALGAMAARGSTRTCSLG